MRKLLLLALVLGFSSSAFAKRNDYCDLNHIVDLWLCEINGKDFNYLSAKHKSWWANPEIKKGTILRFVYESKNSDYTHRQVKSYCDFNKSIISDIDNKGRKSIICSRV